MATAPNAGGHGVLLPNGCRIVHGEGAAVKRPFDTMPVVLHELDPGGGQPLAGQFGFIPFRDSFRLPRHVHIATPQGQPPRLLSERILVTGGLALVELGGAVMVVAPGTLVDIAPGIPHTWTACPPGLLLPDGTRSDGQFLMVYEYAAPTGFFPIASTEPIADASDYSPYIGDLEAIRFPQLSAAQLRESASFVWDRALRSDLALAA